MPRSTLPVQYGPEYEALLVETIRTGSFTMRLPTYALAFRFRIRVRAYCKALRAEGSRTDLIAAADALNFLVEGDTFRAIRKRDDWDTTAIRAALGQRPDSANTLAERLQRIREENLKK